MFITAHVLLLLFRYPTKYLMEKLALEKNCNVSHERIENRIETGKMEKIYRDP